MTNCTLDRASGCAIGELLPTHKLTILPDGVALLFKKRHQFARLRAAFFRAWLMKNLCHRRLGRATQSQQQYGTS
jgi:hypothetical protein